jgi:hypothetical protein
MRWLGIVVAALSLAACISYTREPSPTVVVPSGANVICPNGTAAVYSDGAYRC